MDYHVTTVSRLSVSCVLYDELQNGGGYEVPSAFWHNEIGILGP